MRNIKTRACEKFKRMSMSVEDQNGMYDRIVHAGNPSD